MRRHAAPIISGLLSGVYGLRRMPELALWVVVFPAVILVAASLFFLGGQEAPAAGYYGPEDLASAIESAGFRAVAYDDLEAMVEDVSNGRIAAGVYMDEGRPVVAYIRPSRALAEALSLSIAGGNFSGVAMVELEPGPLAVRGTAIAYYSVNVAGLMTLYIGVYGGLVEVIRAKRRGLLKLVLASPLGPGGLLAFLAASLIPQVTISWATIALVALAMGADYGSLGPERLAAATLWIYVATMIAMTGSLILAPLVRVEEAAAAIASLIVIPTAFAGGIIVPEHMMPGWARALPSLLPPSIAVSASREALIGGGVTASLYTGLPSLLALLVLLPASYAAIRLVIASVLERP